MISCRFQPLACMMVKIIRETLSLGSNNLNQEQHDRPKQKAEQSGGARERVLHLINPGGSNKATSASNLTLAVVFSTLTMVFTKVIGFAREIVIAQKIGYGYLNDAYILGFAVPDLFYELLIGGAISAAITPTLSAAIEHNDEERTWKPVSIFFSVISVVMLIVVVLGGLFIKPLLLTIYANNSIQTIEIAASIGRILFFQTFFFILVGQLTAVLSANKEFVIPNFGSALYNICCLIFIFIFANPSEDGLKKTSVGIVLSAIVYFLFLLYFAKPNMRYFKFNLDIRNKEFRKLLRIALPAIVAGSFNQLNYIIQQVFTGNFDDGAVTSLGHAQKLYNLPYGIIAAGIGSVVVANLSGFYSRQAIREARAFLTATLRMALFLIVPFAVLFSVSNFETVQAVFQWNVKTYNNEGIALTGKLLAVFSINMIVMMLNYFYSQAFYAMKKSYIALITGGITLIFNPLFSSLFIYVFEWGIMSIGLAALGYNLVNFLIINLLLRYFERDLVPQKLPGYAVQLLGSALISAFCLYLFQLILPVPSSKILQLLLYLLRVLLVAGSYISASYFLRVSESRGLVAKLAGRFRLGTRWADAVEKIRKKERDI